ncbi:KCP protein, partial [Polypterus senegalus]|nr:KCP protein [Polypterus senegalus]
MEDSQMWELVIATFQTEKVIDLLEALNITRSIKGVSKTKGLDPGIPAWKFRQRVPHLTLPRDYSIYFLTTMQDSIGFHFVAQQVKNSDGTLISFVSPAALKKDGHPLFRLVSSTRSNQLHLEYRTMHSKDPATILFPGGTPFANGKWARVALNLEAHKVTLFIDCEESIIFEKKHGEDVLSMILPIDLEITFASMPGNKASKFLGYWQTAEISPTGFLRRPWHCENLSDALSYSLMEVNSDDTQLESPIKTSKHFSDDKSDIEHYQQQQSEPDVLPRGPRPHPLNCDERIRRLEETVDNISMMLSMVKSQNTDLLARVKYLETCECRRPQCSWEGRNYDDGSRWEKDQCTACTCTNGQVQCSVNEKCTGCIYEGKRYDNGESFNFDQCVRCMCLSGDVKCETTQCNDAPCGNPVKRPGECCPMCEGCEYEGVAYINGAIFLSMSNPCMNCSCLDSLVRCSPIQCHTVTCLNPFRKPGQCCPSCPVCEVDGQIYDHEQTFTTADGCQKCTCMNGKLSCLEIQQCPHFCTHGVKPPFGSCCRDCSNCDFQGQLIPNGISFMASGDMCKQCTCNGAYILVLNISINQNGDNKTTHVTSADVWKVKSCVKGRGVFYLVDIQQILKQDLAAQSVRVVSSMGRNTQMVPVCIMEIAARIVSVWCEECDYESQTFVHGQSFISSHNPCLSCRCLSGEVTCEHMELSCPPVMCTHPAKLTGQCCATCDMCEYERRIYPNGKEFTPPGSSACLHCICKGGNVRCKEEVCPAVYCSNPVKEPHQCCASCKVCILDGVEFEEGAEWEPDEDACSICTCSNGEVICQVSQCPPLSCQHPSKSNKGDCCASCDSCMYNQRIYNNGQDFIDPDSPCQNCRCQDGTVQCIPNNCPRLHCSNPDIKSGQCCPRCPDCTFENRVFVDGEKFPNPLNPCQECICVNGHVNCENRDCPGAVCTYPMPGTCCRNNCNAPPAECFYSGLPYKHMERFYDPVDKCRSCICNNGTITCQRKPCAPVLCTHPIVQDCCRTCDVTCPAVNCRHPVKPPGECCPQCTGICHYLGNIYESGATFDSSSDSCSVCTCMNEVVTCQKKPCREQCTHPVPSSSCCPVCDQCFLDGTEFGNRQAFLSPSDSCQRCNCLNGNVVCTGVICPQTTCTSPRTIPGQCCPECLGCTYLGKEYAEGVHWISSINECLECGCVRGEVKCSEVHCDVKCTDPVLVPGQCCPYCQDCFFEGKVYLNGDLFHPDTCRQCSCKKGNVHCGSTPCPPLNCMQQVTDVGSCCPRCKDCVYNNHVYGPQESFQPADDPCEICTCEVMPDGEQHLRCYRKQCPSLVDCPKSHIHFPSPDQCCPTCAQPLSNCTATLLGNEIHATDDPCYTCQCKDLTWTCIHQGCPHLSCPSSEQFTPADSCCPICDECLIESENRRVSDGERWTDSVDECITCTCNLGHIECHIEECLPVICQDGLVKMKSPGKCCYECQDPNTSCIYQSTTYQSNEHWEVDECTTCTCVSGEVHCQTERCPQVTCASDETAALIPGMCCPHCIPRPATCIAFGDPHYRTFDGKMINFQGTCTYVLAEDCEGGDFSIHTTNDDKGRKGVSWIKEVTVLIGDVVVQLLQDWIVLVQGENVTNVQCADGDDVDPCKEAGYRARKEGNSKCKILKSKVFERCHSVVPPEMFFASCVYDLCACGSNVDDCLCDALEAYASECREAGIILHWRSPSLCAVGCPQDRGYVFDECGPPCPKTCFNKDVPLGVIEAHCFKPCIPGCQCPAGLVEHESHCILPESCPRIIYGNI